MTTKTATRAPAGGTIAINGEFYPGGTFLPSTLNGKQPASTRPAAKARKQQIAPYTYEFAPTADGTAIYGLIVGAVAVCDRAGLLHRHEAGIAYYGESIRGHAVDDLISRYNRGDRWI